MNVLAVAAALLLPGMSADTLTATQIKAQYEQLFGVIRLEAEGSSFLAFHFPPLAADHPFSGLMQDNMYVFLYLLENAADVPREALMQSAADSVQLEQEFLAHLRRDEGFNRYVLPILGAYLRTQGHVVHELPPTPGSGTTDWSHLMNVAARFFYPSAVRPDGGFEGHICVGVNGFKDFEGERDLLVEAFAYAAIFQDLHESRYNVGQEFSAVLRSLRSLNLSADPERKLLRAQGITWARMTENEVLRTLLADAYEAKQHFLPFTVVH